MVDQADRLFGARHYDRYEFLFAMTSQLGGIGLEHHRSSENTAAPNYFSSPNPAYGARGLLPHEYVHSWNGKFRRPSDEYVANLNVPTQNTLMWVYEGQTEYWGDVLTPRSLEEALSLKAVRPEAMPIAGGTERVLGDGRDPGAPVGRGRGRGPRGDRTGGAAGAGRTTRAWARRSRPPPPGAPSP